MPKKLWHQRPKMGPASLCTFDTWILNAPVVADVLIPDHQLSFDDSPSLFLLDYS